MKQKVKAREAKQSKQSAVLERGINLDVPGTALIAQADERIKWHKQMAATLEEEVASIDEKGTESRPPEWETRSRRTELARRISAHLEHARFLTFVRNSLVQTRHYRIGLADMYSLELMPKGSCL